jgi:hypothetical protein
MATVRDYCCFMRRVVAGLLALALSIGLSAAVITQRTTVNGVSVAVTAGNLGPEASVWDFAVVLDSPRRNLPDDLLTSAVLVDPEGRKYKALMWEGGPSRGRHRAGVLKFAAVDPRPDSIELRISRPGEKKPRSFSWLLGSGMMASR